MNLSPGQQPMRGNRFGLRAATEAPSKPCSLREAPFSAYSSFSAFFLPAAVSEQHSIRDIFPGAGILKNLTIFVKQRAYGYSGDRSDMVEEEI